jgi:diguanylate cyclase (GGDEF)-like protein
MTMFKQLFIGASLGFLFLVAGIELIYTNNARIYLQEQLASHSQDAATSLSMVLSSSMADGDQIRTETIVNAIFDRGYYQSIRVISTRGDTVIYKNIPFAPSNVPTWFTSHINLETPVAESMISKGWHQLGRVIVSSYPQIAYQQLWRTMFGVSLWLLGFYITSLLLLYIFLKNILKPLEEIEQVAHAISERDFKTVKANPKSRELKKVIYAINTLSNKIHSIIESDINAANHFRAEAYTDELTKLDNRRSFEQQLQAILDNQSDIESGVLYLIQIANFKEINSTQGYLSGDNLLKLTGSVLADTLKEHNLIRSRINGATFAIATFDLSHDVATQFAQAICKQLNLAFKARQHDMQVIFGCGGTFFHNEKVTLGVLMAEADLATRQSISNGDNGMILLDYKTDSNKEEEDNNLLFWKQFLIKVLNENRFALLAQPVISIKDSSKLQFEMVGRIIADNGELIPASEFMPMAIRHNLNSRIDKKLIEKIFHLMGENTELTDQVAINLSIRSIQDPEFINWLTSILSKHSDLACRTVFEFSEVGVMQNLELMGRFIEKIRRLKANFAVDNFGLHHKAFEYLQILRPAYIKLCPIFITDLPENHANQFLISSVVNIANPLDIKIFAHSVENADVLELLNKLGIDGYQGFATGIPIRID